MVYREETRLQVSHLVSQIENSKTTVPIEHVAKQPGSGSDLFHQTEITAARPVSLPALTTKTHIPKKNQTRSCLANSLFHSVYKCRYQKTKFLLEKGYVVNSKNDYGYNALFAALQIENGPSRRKMLRLLLEYDVDPFECDGKHKRNTLHWAAHMGRSEEIKIIFESYMGEFDFHQRDKGGMTPLHLAACAGHADVVRNIVKEMVRYGMTVDVTDYLGLTPYLHAKRMGYDDIAAILVNDGKASAGKADEFSFKKAEEWREIGIQERSRHIMDTQLSKAAIYGRMKIAFSDSGSDSQSVTSTKRVGFVPESIIRKNKPQAGKVARDPDFTLPSSNLDNTRWRLSKIAAPTSSEISKSDTYKHAVWDLQKMMDFWGHQHTRSFRSPVVPKVTFEEKVVPCHKKTKESRRHRKAKAEK